MQQIAAINPAVSTAALTAFGYVLNRQCPGYTASVLLTLMGIIDGLLEFGVLKYG